MWGPARRRVVCLLLAAGTLVLGLAVRFARLGLPASVVKYGGSALWAAMIYWLAAAGLGRSRPLRVGVLAGTVCWAVEWFKLVRTPALDAFRLTLAGKLLLGRYFSGSDLLAYAAALLAVVLLDSMLPWRSDPGRTATERRRRAPGGTYT